MRRSVKLFFSGLAVVLLCSLSASAEMAPCAQCGMGADLNSKFTARTVLAKQTLHFCDIGDLFAYLKTHPAAAAEAQVKDYKTGDWIKARQAYYVHSAGKFQTPMGWGIAAFKAKQEAADFGTALDFDGMMK